MVFLQERAKTLVCSAYPKKPRFPVLWRKMRLLHLISSLDPTFGGPIENIRQMAPIYLARHIEAEVVALDPPDASYLRDFPMKVQTFNSPHLGRYRYSPQLIPWLRQNHRKYDCVIVNGIWQFHSLACWVALRKTETPYVVFTHGMLDPWFRRHYPLKHLKKWLYWHWAEYRVMRDAKVVLFTSEEERSLAAKSFWPYQVNPLRCRLRHPCPQVRSARTS